MAQCHPILDSGCIKDFRDALVIHIKGDDLWGRLLDIVETRKCEAAINSGQAHGIRLTREMILGIVSLYSNQTTEMSD